MEPMTGAVAAFLKQRPWITHSAGTAVMVGMEAHGFHGRVHSGENPWKAAGASAFNLAGGLLVNPFAFGALTIGAPILKAAGQMVTHTLRHHHNHVRHMRTPFSHRFEHTEVTAAAQQYGLQQLQSGIMGAQMGLEAANMAARYGRR